MRWILTLLALLACTRPAAPATYTVLPDGSGDYPTLQAAVDAAVSGDVIELGPGTFSGDGNRDIDLTGRALHICARDGVAATCILDCQGSPSAPHRAFVFTSGEGAATILENLTLTGGCAWRTHAGAPTADARGGAIYCAGASPTIRDCVLSGSTAEFEGGALFAAEGAAPVLEDCVLSANHATSGGGAFCHSATASLDGCSFTENTARSGAGLGARQSPISLSACTFVDNAASLGGGGASLDNAEGAEFSTCAFNGNSAGYGGAVSCFNGGTPAFTGCTFAGNLATGSGDWPTGCGGGLFTDVFASPVLTTCDFHDNGAGADGGGIYTNGAQTHIEDCMFKENTAGTSGGGLYGDSDFLEVSDCLLRDNAAVSGGGAFLHGGFPTLSDCTFYANEATAGGGIALQAGTCTLVACTLHRNSASRGGGLVALAGTRLSLERVLVASGSAGEGVACDGCTEISLTCCNIFGNAGGDYDDPAISDQLGTSGNVAASPHFCYAYPQRYEVWSVHEDSPCAPAQSACGLIGAWGADCSDTPVRAASWGEIKAVFRP